MVNKRRAAIIGINSYKDEKIESLSGAVNDATELRDILRDRGEFTIDDGRDFLVDGDATGERIRGAISDLFWETEQCDIALFYFAGHGRRDHLENGFLLPYDVQYKKPFVHGIEIQELKRLFLRAQPKTTGLLILDCCYSGIATRAERSGPDDGKSIESFYNALVLEGAGSGRYILASADAEKTAREEQREHTITGGKHVHGLFSFHLIEALQGAAKDKAGRVSLGAVVEHLDRAFPSASKHRPQFAVGSGIGMHDIFLAESVLERQAFIESTLNEVRSRLEEETARSLLIAIRNLHDLDRRGLKGDNARDIEEEIKKRTAPLVDQVLNWWVENSIQLPPNCQKSILFDALREVSLSSCFDTIKRLDNRNLAFLIECVQDIIAGKSAARIGEIILLTDRDRNAKVGAGDATKNRKLSSPENGPT